MKLKIQSVKEHGTLKTERLILKALEGLDVGDYMIANTRYIDESEVSNKLRYMFWLPDKKVDKGDLIVIYSKEGDDTTKTNDSGNKTHFFYWGLESSVWKKEKDAAVIFSIKDWNSEKI